MKVTALTGGVGGAKLLVGFDRALTGGELTAVVNTGDDAVIYGVHVAPDIDIVTYWLAGIADRQRGWGIAGDGRRMLEGLSRLGHETWFQLGDLDFATCFHRTTRLRDGAVLSTITDEIRASLGLRTKIVPMSDDPVRTIVETRDGRRLEFQQYFVKERSLPQVARVDYRDSEDAKPAPGVLDAVENADLVVVCPSNPLLSIGPILSLPGVRERLRDHPAVVAVSPIVRGVALKGPADKILNSVGIGASASAVADLYRDFCDIFVVDSSDAAEAPKVEAHGLRAIAEETIMNDDAAAEALARSLLKLAP